MHRSVSFPLSFYFDISCCFVDIQKEINAVKLWCSLFVVLTHAYGVQSVVSSLDSCEKDLSSAQHRSIPSWCACCKSSINFTNKLKCVEERLHTFVWSLLCAIAPLSSSIPHMTSLYFSPPLLSRITHPRASRETLWGSFDWNDTAASGILK